MSLKIADMSPAECAQFDRDHAELMRYVGIFEEKQKLEKEIQAEKNDITKLQVAQFQARKEQVVRNALKQAGELKIQEGHRIQAAAQAKITNGQAQIAAAITTRDHALLVNALAKMILATVDKMPPENGVTSAQKAKSIVEPILIKYEQQKTPELTVCIEASKCMKLTSGVAIVISEVLAKVVCTSPDLTKFQKEIDPQALQRVLSDIKITQVTFHASVEGTPIEQVALEVYKTRHLKIAFDNKSSDLDVKVHPVNADLKVLDIAGKENRRQSVAKALSLVFKVEQESLVNSLSMEDSQEFEINSKQQVFAMLSEASAETVIALLKNKKLTTLDLSIFTAISDQAWAKLCKGLPETVVNKIVFSKQLVPQNGDSRDKQFKLARILMKNRGQMMQISTLKV